LSPFAALETFTLTAGMSLSGRLSPLPAQSTIGISDRVEGQVTDRNSPLSARQYKQTL
jgi:hypothetical protein